MSDLRLSRESVKKLVPFGIAGAALFVVLMFLLRARGPNWEWIAGTTALVLGVVVIGMAIRVKLPPERRLFRAAIILNPALMLICIGIALVLQNFGVKSGLQLLVYMLAGLAMIAGVILNGADTRMNRPDSRKSSRASNEQPASGPRAE